VVTSGTMVKGRKSFRVCEKNSEGRGEGMRNGNDGGVLTKINFN